MRIIASLVCGLVFGAGLLISGMVQPTKVLGFLDIFGAWDPSLAVVMIAALAVSVPGFSWRVAAPSLFLTRTAFGRPKTRSIGRSSLGRPCSAWAGGLSVYARGRRWKALRRCRRASSSLLPPWLAACCCKISGSDPAR